MNIEELAFKNRVELANLNEIDLLDIIEFLQEDRKQWINQFSKTHNESVDIQKENKQLKDKIKIYEDPEDLTLMFMYCEEKAKDKTKKLKRQYENAVADYETTMSEKIELERQLEEYKKQVHKGLYSTCLPYTTGYNKAMKDNRIQQKEFIKFLEDEIEQNTPNLRWKHYNEDGFNDYDVENPTYIETQPTHKVLKEVLQKYKSVVGASDDNKTTI